MNDDSDKKFLNIAGYLPKLAQEQPDALAVVVQGRQDRDGRFAYRKLTAKELDEESNRLASGLLRAGIGRGTRTVLMVPPSLEFFTLTFALFKVGAVPVLVDPGMGIKNLKACLAEAEPEAFIGVTKAHVARVLLGWARKTLRIKITVGPRLFWGGHTLRSLWVDDTSQQVALTEPDEIAAILFTSGSTGIPKGAVYTHAIFDAQIAVLRDYYGVEPGERDLATFPLFALFGPALGMAAIVPDMDASKPITADPAKILAAIDDFDATNIFASPALLDKVGRYGEKNAIKISSVRRVISAGAPADPESLARFSTLLDDGTPILPSYGATEALPVCSIESEELIRDTSSATNSGAGVCVGRPVGHVEIKIVQITDGPIPNWSDAVEMDQGEIGEICVRGPVVTREYFRRPDSTQLAKIADPDSGTFYHRMGDVGYLDGPGRLWFCGRKAHRVVTEAETLFTIPCERIFNTHALVRRTALVGIENEGKTSPVLCVELNEGTPDSSWERVESELRKLTEQYDTIKSIKTFLYHPGFPMDVRHNAKIFREKLAAWAADVLK
ncbi:MAG: AMP-binding protein [Candidatus Hydrogenedentes bacterium]|nr:AMP-binding protein [Candidatus Hydrogenedentota bacterium]